MNKPKIVTKGWTEEEKGILNKYYQDHGPNFCCGLLTKNKGSTVVMANKLGLKVIKLHELIDHKNFIKMDSLEAVYIAGFLFADGYCRKNNPQISLHISKQDMKEIYPVLCKFGKWGYSNYQSNNGRSCYVFTSNKFLYDFFCNMDYKEKSYEEPTKILNYIPKKLHFMFWRGFIDGDGTWYCKKEGYGTFSVVGNHDYKWIEFSKMLKEIGVSNFSFNRRVRDCGKTSSVFFSLFDNLKLLGEYIYQNRNNDKIGLTRKYNKFLNIMKRKDPTKVILVNLKTKELLKFESFAKASRFLNIKPHQVKLLCEKEKECNGFKCSFKNKNEELLQPCPVQ